MIISWNIRGFNDPINQQEVRGYLSTNKIEVFGLLETRVKYNNSAAISKRFASFSIINNYSHHYNGRIWVFLNPSIVTVISSKVHDQLIHLEMLHHISNKVVNVTFVYGSNDGDDRNEGNLEETHSFGCGYTWTNKRDVDERIWSKLDRVLVNPGWLAAYPNTQVTILPSGISDHSPLLIQAKNVRHNLQSLHRTHFAGLTKRVQEAKKELEDCQYQIQQNLLTSELLVKEKSLLEVYLSLKKTGRSSLIQRAKVQNIQHNDAPNSYFFSRIAIRKNQSIIGKIHDRNVQIRDGIHNVNQAFVEYYQALLGKKVETIGMYSSLLRGSQVPDSEWPNLCKPVEEMEIKRALFSIDSNKSPGHDGFSAQFFKKS
ncbi:uncharacterized protein LOC141613594 [Silene latifolia]|uniref:uncharacterized protein LOC141613594 n=1 Tax=Silene latifolia TaxID=37657 RepID=UPI003D7896F6